MEKYVTETQFTEVMAQACGFPLDVTDEFKEVLPFLAVTPEEFKRWVPECEEKIYLPIVIFQDLKKGIYRPDVWIAACEYFGLKYDQSHGFQVTLGPSSWLLIEVDEQSNHVGVRLYVSRALERSVRVFVDDLFINSRVPNPEILYILDLDATLGLDAKQTPKRSQFGTIRVEKARESPLYRLLS